MENDYKMTSKKDINIIGRCCRNKGDIIILYNGNPSKNYAVILCEKHFNQSPFNKHILKIIPLEEN